MKWFLKFSISLIVIVGLIVSVQADPPNTELEIIYDLENPEDVALLNELLRKLNRVDVDADDDEFTNLTSESSLASGDEILIYDVSASAYRKAVWSDIHPTVVNTRNSLWDTFAGDGSDGAQTVSTNTNFSTIDNATYTGTAQYTSLNVSANTLTIDTGYAYIAVSGTCTIAGTIDADAQGEAGGQISATGDNQFGGAGLNAAGVGDTSLLSVANGAVKGFDNTSTTVLAETHIRHAQQAVPFAVSGAGGSGSGSGDDGAPGGGAGGHGGGDGTTQQNGQATPTKKLLALTGGLGDNSSHGYAHLVPQILQFAGAGGGAGRTVGSSGKGTPGGAGGGIIYIECDELVFTGTLTADGQDGQSAGGGGPYYGGGGGGGGIILIRANTLTTNTGTVTVTGGSGYAGTSTGGNGAAGFKDIIDVTP